CDKAVGDQTAEVKGDLCPVTVRYRDWSAILTSPVYLAHLSEGREKLTGSRNTERVAPRGLRHLVCGAMPGFIAESDGNAARYHYSAESGQTNHRSDLACPGEIANMNLVCRFEAPFGVFHLWGRKRVERENCQSVIKVICLIQRKLF